MKVLLPFLLLIACQQPRKPNQITLEDTDERGLTSVLFIQDGKEWGMDYLTPYQLDSLKAVLSGELTEKQKIHKYMDSVYMIPINPYLAK